MKRPVTEVLRRSFDITLVNWPLIAIRIAEAMIFMAILIGSVLAAVVPLIVSAGLSKDEITRAANPAEAISAVLVQHWMLLVYVLLFATFVIGLLMALHSFVQGGSAQIYVDAERAGGSGQSIDRNRFAAFNMERFLGGGRKSWWSIFWIYNLGGSVGALIILVPLLLTIVAMLALGDATGRIVAGCAGLVLSLLVLLPVGIIVSMWCEKAIAVTVARSAAPRDSLRAAWREMKADFGRHFVVAVLITIAGIVLIGALSALSLPMSFGSRHANLPLLSMMFAPVQIGISIVEGAASAISSGLMLAAFVVLTEER